MKLYVLSGVSYVLLEGEEIKKKFSVGFWLWEDLLPSGRPKVFACNLRLEVLLYLVNFFPQKNTVAVFSNLPGIGNVNLLNLTKYI